MPKSLLDSATVPCPFRVIVDTREQAPYTFRGIPSNAETERKPFHVETIRTGLAVGDYSIEGEFTDPLILIERKSKVDLFGSVAKRDNFEGRLERLDTETAYAAIVVEAEWREILTDPPRFSGYNPTALHRTVQSWTQRYKNVHWWFYPDRASAETATFWLLYRFHANLAQHRLAKHRQRANDQAYRAGLAACHKGVPIGKNPYPRNHVVGDFYDHWTRGWLDMEAILRGKSTPAPDASEIGDPVEIKPAADELMEVESEPEGQGQGTETTEETATETASTEPAPSNPETATQKKGGDAERTSLSLGCAAQSPRGLESALSVPPAPKLSAPRKRGSRKS